MTERERIEQQIRELLGSETRAIPLSDRLFSPGGLFDRLAETEEERRLVAQSSLFREALKRLSALQKQEAAAFARAVELVRTAAPEDYLLKLEATRSA